MNVLVIEDEKKIASFVRKGLEAQGFVVDVSHHGDEGYTLATTRPYDALVLDIMLPGKDGLSILRTLRAKQMALPVILLTARSELNERLEGLNLGADDYLTKPFFIEELIARLHVITRRASGASQSILAVADLTVNLLTREVTRGGRKIDLTAREFELLEHFARSPGRVLTRSQICERVWNYDFDPGTMVPWYAPKEQHFRMFPVKIAAGSMNNATKDRDRQVAISLFRLGGTSRKDMLRQLGYGDKRIEQVEQEIAEEHQGSITPDAVGKGATPRLTRSSRAGNPY